MLFGMGKDDATAPAPPAPTDPEPRAKPLRPRLPLASPPPELVPARMINEVLFCERLLYLEWAQGEWADNYFTADGNATHRRADAGGGDLPPKDGSADPERPYEARQVWLSSERLGITAKIDVVEGAGSGVVSPIEYKRGKAPDVPEGAYLPERAQVAAQVLLLREHGYTVDEAFLYFGGSRRRVPIVVDDELVATTLAAIARAREIAGAAAAPPPLVESPKCAGCSLSGICLPDEVTFLREHPPLPAEAEADAGAAEPAPAEEPELRRLQPARDDALPFYVQDQWGRVSLSGEELVAKTKEAEQKVRLANTTQVNLMGNIQVTSQALRALLERGIPTAFFSQGGWFYGFLQGLPSKNIELRVAQHEAARDPAVCLDLARRFVTTKIRNCRTMLRRNDESASEAVLFELKQLARRAEACEKLESLLGVEGTAARVYFGAFTGMIKGDAKLTGAFDLDGRNRRPPRDPVNALLSLAYSLLAKDFTVTLAAVGLEPLLGFYHRPRFGRPALALDMMEELRPIVADSVVLSAINTRVVEPGDFILRGGAASLAPHARKRFILAYERRMDQLVTHPVFGYRVSYRRVLEVQARLLARVLLGEIAAYPPFFTR